MLALLTVAMAQCGRSRRVAGQYPPNSISDREHAGGERRYAAFPKSEE
jgi:hypothetical protein